MGKMESGFSSGEFMLHVDTTKTGRLQEYSASLAAKRGFRLRYVGRSMSCGSRPPACCRNPKKTKRAAEKLAELESSASKKLRSDSPRVNE